MTQSLMRDKRFLTGLALALIVVVGFWLRVPLVGYNQPVAAYVDERKGLLILQRFDQGDLNPDYFHYPTFYYYATYFAIAAFGPEHFLSYGRLLNLLFGCGLAVATYWLARQMSASRPVGLTAAALCMTSFTLIRSASYIITDVLMALLAVLALVFWTRYYQARDLRFWLLGVVAAGLSISTKYPAGVLVVVYVVMELVIIAQPDSQPAELGSAGGLARFINRRFSPLLIAGALLAAGLAIIAAAPFIQPLLVSVAGNYADVDSTLDAGDLAYLSLLARRLAYAGWALLALAVISFLLRRYLARWCVWRPLLGLGLIALCFIIGSPYALLSWQSFVYDVGAEVRFHAAVGEGGSWLFYVFRLTSREGLVAPLLLLPGAIILARRQRSAFIPVCYLAIYSAIIASVDWGAPRYLVPALPVAFICAAAALWALADYLGTRFGTRTRVVFLLVAAVVLSVDVLPGIARATEIVGTTDEMHGSYEFVSSLKPEKVYYSGYAPWVELQMSGLPVENVPLAVLQGGQGVEQMGPRDVLLLQGSHNNLLPASVKAGLRLVWSSDLGDGQYVYTLAE